MRDDSLGHRGLGIEVNGRCGTAVAENVLCGANVRLLPSDEQPAERMPQVMESESLSRLEENPCLDGRRPQLVRHQHISHARRPFLRFPGRKHPVPGVTIPSRRLMVFTPPIPQLS